MKKALILITAAILAAALIVLTYPQKAYSPATERETMSTNWGNDKRLTE